MKRKSQVLYWEIKACIEENPKTINMIAKELGFDYHRIFDELKDLEKLGKIVSVKHEGEAMMLWLDKVPQFEYELDHNIVEFRKVDCQFIGTPSIKNQIKLPMFVLRALKDKIDLQGKFDLMLEVKAIQANDIWYKIETKIGEK